MRKLAEKWGYQLTLDGREVPHPPPDAVLVPKPKRKREKKRPHPGQMRFTA